MKKFITVLLAAATVFAFSACGTKTATKDTKTTDDKKAATSYDNLAVATELTSEEYGIGFRKGSDLVAKINEFFKTSKENGETEKIAEKYGVQAALAK